MCLWRVCARVRTCVCAGLCVWSRIPPVLEGRCPCRSQSLEQHLACGGPCLISVMFVRRAKTMLPVGTRRAPLAQGQRSEELSGRLAPGRARKEQRTDGRMAEAPTSGAFEDRGWPPGCGVGTALSRREPSCELRSRARTAAVLGAQSRCPSAPSSKFSEGKSHFTVRQQLVTFPAFETTDQKTFETRCGEGRSLLAKGVN